MDADEKVVLAEGNDASPKPSDFPFAELGGLEVEADPNAEPQHQRSDPLPGCLVARDGRLLVEHRHQPLDLLLRTFVRYGLVRASTQLIAPSACRVPLDPHLVEGLGESVVSGVILFPGHALVGRHHVLVKLLDPPPQVRERRMLLDRRITDGLFPRLRQESFPDHREHPVVGDEGRAAQNQISLQHQYLKHILRPPKAITLQDEHMQDRRIGLRIRQELQKPERERSPPVTASSR